MTDSKVVRESENGINVVFIHGINSSNQCWQHEDGAFWPDLLKAEEEFSEVGIYNFSYRTGFNTGSYSLGDIVSSLREYFKEYDLFRSQEIIFVCHSMGGIIARRFLVVEKLRLFENDPCRIGLFLVASPSLGSEYANRLGLVSKALGHSQANALKFSQSNQWLNDLDAEFINLKESKSQSIFGKELIEDLPLFLKGFFRTQVVEPFSGARYFGESFKIPDSDHSTIAAPKDEHADQHRALVRFINENSFANRPNSQRLKK